MVNASNMHMLQDFSRPPENFNTANTQVIPTTQMDLVNPNDVSEVRLDFTEQKDEYDLNPAGAVRI